MTYLWADLAGHLARTWTHTQTAAEQLYGSVISDRELPDVSRVMSAWRDTDRLAAALEDLTRHLHSDE